MTSDEVREIVREEIAAWWDDLQAASRAATDQWTAKHREEWLERARANPGDGPLLAEIKGIMRERLE